MLNMQVATPTLKTQRDPKFCILIGCTCQAERCPVRVGRGDREVLGLHACSSSLTLTLFHTLPDLALAWP